MLANNGANTYCKFKRSELASPTFLFICAFMVLGVIGICFLCGDNMDRLIMWDIEAYWYIYLADNMSHPFNTHRREPLCVWSYIPNAKLGISPIYNSLLFYLLSIPVIYLVFKSISPLAGEVGMAMLLLNGEFARLAWLGTREAEIMFFFYLMLYAFLRMGKGMTAVCAGVLTYLKFIYIPAALLTTILKGRKAVAIWGLIMLPLIIYLVISKGTPFYYIAPTTQPEGMQACLPSDIPSLIKGSFEGAYDFWVAKTSRVCFWGESGFIYWVFMFVGMAILVSKKALWGFWLIVLMATAHTYYLIHYFWGINTRHVTVFYPVFAICSATGLVEMVKYFWSRR